MHAPIQDSQSEADRRQAGRHMSKVRKRRLIDQALRRLVFAAFGSLMSISQERLSTRITTLHAWFV